MKYILTLGLEFVVICLFFMTLIFGLILVGATEPRCQTDMECVEMFGDE